MSQFPLPLHQQPDYDDIEDENRPKLIGRGGKSDKGKDKQKYGKLCQVH